MAKGGEVELEMQREKVVELAKARPEACMEPEIGRSSE